MSELESMHKEIETIFGMNVDHIHADLLHRYIDEQHNQLVLAQSEAADYRRAMTTAREAFQEIYSMRGEDEFIEKTCNPMIYLLD